jgi:hypothetical protein
MQEKTVQVKEAFMEEIHEKVSWWHSLMKAWRRSLGVFHGQTLLLLVGVTFNAFLQVARYYGWLFIGMGFLDCLLERYMLQLIHASRYSVALPLIFGSIVFHGIGMITLVGICRPAVTMKHLAYWRLLMQRGYRYIFVLCGSSFLGYALKIMLSGYKSFAFILLLQDAILQGFLSELGTWPLGWWYGAPLMIFSTLFILDDVSKALRKAFIMTIYDYPLCLVITLLNSLGYYGVAKLQTSTAVALISYSLLYASIVPLSILFLVNLYSKRVHENYEDYV